MYSYAFSSLIKSTIRHQSVGLVLSCLLSKVRPISRGAFRNKRDLSYKNLVPELPEDISRKISTFFQLITLNHSKDEEITGRLKGIVCD